ncbi:DNA-binding response regulator [Spiribacter halobius]|uniref:DNA-binding response regulator n=1 Tax=Sediminicurvatus halobius TaxID=2182432 RepID=A0A2U2N6F2_9GAMM|nr:DNA-binding response regulator [Spiribacter halobius]
MLVIDDEIQIRRFLRISLASEGYEVLEASSGERGIELAATGLPALVILDLGLPGQDGQEVLSAIRREAATPVLVLSVRGGERDKVRALDAGANDYVTKPFGLEEFLARVRNLLRVPQWQIPGDGVYDDGQLRIDLQRRRVTAQGVSARLTAKEYEVLRRLMAQPDQVVTQGHLLREIWGPTHGRDTHYLRIIVGRLRQKLGDDPTEPRYIHTEPGVGYRLAFSLQGISVPTATLTSDHGGTTSKE